MRSSRRFSAAAAAALAAAVLTAAPASADYPTVDALTPGAPIATYLAEGSKDGACTAGWLARDKAGATYMLTAGHCFSDGAGGHAMVRYAESDYHALGTADYVLYDAAEVLTPDRTDIAVVALDDGVAIDARVLERRPVSGAVKIVEVGDRVCKFGAESGRRDCGPVTEVTEYRIKADFDSRSGDSGSPVYAIDDRGVAHAVGIHTGVMSEGGASIQPISATLRERGLELIPAPKPAPQPGIAPISHR